jgi:hypothetical protein
MGWFESAMTCDLEETDGFGIFWEADGRNTKELCNLLLRAWSKEIDLDWAGRTNLGGEDGLMPANHRHKNAIKQSFWIPIGSVYCGVENKQNQAVSLEMPLVLPRSFLTPSVISGIFMKWYSLNQPMLFLLKWLAIVMIVSRLSSDGLLGWMKSHEVLLHSLLCR